MLDGLTEIEYCTLDMPCAYLKERKARMLYKYVFSADFAYNSNLVSHGYRRFGKYFSKPVCKGCDECKSLRIDALSFEFSRGLKRVLRKNINTKISVRTPYITQNHIDLYEKYHKFMDQKRGWEYYNMSYERYFGVYVDGAGDFGLEIDYFVEEKLVCVDLVDMTSDGISSIYCFWDPDFAHLSLGKYSLLNQIIMARANSLRWIYLGFYVKECESLEYKGEYEPYEILRDYVELDEEPVWERSREP